MQIEVKGKTVLVDKEDVEKISNFTWCLHSCGYVCTNKKDEKGILRTYFLHRFLVSAPKGKDVDHINGDKLDNRKSNLRICSRQENLRNQKRRSDNTSGFKGVIWSKQKNKWQARIINNYKIKHLGFFNSPEEAAKSYDSYAKRLFKEFALTNF